MRHALLASAAADAEFGQVLAGCIILSTFYERLRVNAELIIEVQKKVAALLGNPIPNIQIDEEN
jgi:hypothetical protein